MLEYSSKPNCLQPNSLESNYILFCENETKERIYRKEIQLDEKYCLGNKVIILSNQLKHYLHQAAEAEGISGSQSRILHFLAKESKQRNIYQKDVEDFFCLRRSTVTQTIQSMEKNGLVVRCSVSQDARLKKLTLTPKGEELEVRIHKRVLEMEQVLLSALTIEEAELFQSILVKMSNKLAESGMADAVPEICDMSCGKERFNAENINETD